MNMETLKGFLAYAGTIALAHVASRYHLSGDQVTAITVDAGTAAAALYGVFAHTKASKNGVPK